MPKATLKFNLPEEQYDFDSACKADKMRNFIFHLNHNFDRQFDTPKKISAETVLEALRQAAKDYEVQDI
jgi:adenosine deaminase